MLGSSLRAEAMSESKQGKRNSGSSSATIRSPNFSFLSHHHSLLVRYAAQAERFVFEDANLALIRLRQFAELVAEQAAAYAGLPAKRDDDFAVVLNRLRERRIATGEVLALFHGLRKAGNAACVPTCSCTCSSAMTSVPAAW
jgi:type I restriction enzyme R subunit